MIIFLSSVEAMAEDEKDYGFYSKHFLEMSEEQQQYWLYGAVNALAMSTGLRNKDNGKCVNNWYFNDTATITWQIIETMKGNTETKPAAVIMFLSEKACGTYWK